ncbi:helix-turn-helix transcriptional regulator [Flavobacterium sp. EDS]|nr:helix-turn-helix transcriptional regulator [Flavobacterium sp. EDS]MCD0476338.1 helix-turn-helix transcriptional regulator [Flavobacterium sp. EDS]
MKVIDHDFDSNRDPLAVIADAVGGVVDGNIVRGDNEIYKGSYSFFNIEEGVLAVLIDVSYKKTLFLKHKNRTNNDGVILYFYLLSTNIDFFLNKKAIQFGKLDYNFIMLDGALDIDYIVKKETHIYGVCVVVKKDTFKEYINKICKIKEDVVFDIKKNVIINIDRMSYRSLDLIKKFRKTAPDTPYYEMNFKALVYALLNNYLEQLKTKKMILGKAVNDDIKRIIISKKFMQKNNEREFPGIDFLAAKALMSISKYKKMFTKTIGVSPAVYFSDSKLEKAKEFIETKQYTVEEISIKLNYSSASYLTRRFTKRYGVSPKEYQNLL